MSNRTLQERCAALIERLREARTIAFPSEDMGLLWNPDDCAEAIEVLTLLGVGEFMRLQPLTEDEIIKAWEEGYLSCTISASHKNKTRSAAKAVVAAIAKAAGAP